MHPDTFELAPTRQVLSAFIHHVRDALDEAGDRDLVVELFEQMHSRGNGAVRQRAALEASGSPARVVADLADRTEASWAT